VLEQRGYVALAASGAEESLPLVQQETIDAVIADLELPGQSGVEVARAIRRIRPETPVVLVTAWPGRLDSAALAACGIEHVVEKPADAVQILDALDSALKGRR
jgi:CheY-like chemotaxis protein